MNKFKTLNLIVGWAVFAIAATVYIMTMEPSTSLWDCAEFIATSYKLEVGHPPGAPLFMMIARLFTIFGGEPSNAAMMVNIMSSLASAFTILFLFWTITHLAAKIYAKKREDLSNSQTWAVIGAGAIGALAYTFTDSFWFSAIEAEVYALSSMFTAMVFWAILQWENVADKPHSTRWLILIAYIMGLSIGIHILNLLTIPAIVFIVYFKKTDVITKWGLFKAAAISGVILLTIHSFIISYTVAFGAWVDRIFVNSLGLPVNSGLTFSVLAIFTFLGWAIYYTHKRGKVVANTIVLCLTVIMIGYSSYASVVIRASANPPMNSNNPNNPYSLLSLLQRDQYGSRPLLFGQTYSSPAIDIKEKENFYLGEDGKYHKGSVISSHIYPSEFRFFLPRMHSSSERHVNAYQSWVDIKGRQIPFNGEVITVPTFGENMQFLFAYQMNFMYWRYFLWNFVGRQSDIQSTGEITDGNWMSGIKPIDSLYLGPQEGVPSDLAENKGRNTYYFLPFLLGLMGLIYQLNRDKRNFTVVMWLFFMMGIALVLYFNTSPGEPRERDYVYAGSFYAFCIWIGFGVLWLYDLLAKWSNRNTKAIALTAIAICSCVPILLATQNWDDHDRSGRYFARDIGANYLNSTLPNSIIMNYGDNDTFPLWYNQEVEGVRHDVRVMNLSYLAADWYIDEMKIKANESEAVPFSLPKRKYTNTNDLIFVRDLFEGKAVSISDAMAFIHSDDPRTQLDIAGKKGDYLPAKRLAIPVNKENAIASGIVAEKDAALMEDTIYININKNTITKDELMLIDLLANFDWKRPLYFTQIHSITPLGLRDYLQFDGLAYRLVPIKTASTSSMDAGRIDTEYLYPKLMEEFKWGNLKDPNVYVDYFINVNLNASESRSGYARLAKALIAEGDTVRAVKVLDRGAELLPFSQVRHSYRLSIPHIEAYYQAKEFEKGNEIFDDYARVLSEYALYYAGFPDSKAPLVDNILQENLYILSELHSLANRNGQKEQTTMIEKFFNNASLE